MATLQSRLASLISAIGTDMKEALTNRVVRLQTLATDPSIAGFLAKLTVNYATTGGTSSDVMQVWYTGDATDSSLATFWLNENGAPRAANAKPGDSALKVVGWGTGQTAHTFLIEQRSGNGTGSRATAWGINKDGNPVLGANEVVGAHAVVIAHTDTGPPSGTPPCVVFKKRT